MMTIGRIAVLAVIFYALFSILNTDKIGEFLAGTDPSIFALSFVVLCARNVIGGYRSHLLLGYRGMHYTTARLTKYYFIGTFFNLFLPTLIGRDIPRGYYLYRSSAGRKESISSILFERVIGTSALMLLSMLSIVIAWFAGLDVFDNSVIRAVFVVFAILSFCILLVLTGYFGRLIEAILPFSIRERMRRPLDMIHDIGHFNRSPRVHAQTLATSLAFQLSAVLSTYLIALSVGAEQSFFYFFILLPVIWLISLVPISINAIGVREGACVLFFSTTGMPQELAMAIGILWSLQIVGLGLIGGLLLLLERVGRAEKH